MQYVYRFCTICQKETMCQVHNDGYVRCLNHDPVEPSKETRQEEKDER
jgi:hypothetical protein